MCTVRAFTRRTSILRCPEASCVQQLCLAGKTFLRSVDVVGRTVVQCRKARVGSDIGIESVFRTRFETLGRRGSHPDVIPGLIPDSTLEARFIWDPHIKVGVCGDWCGGPRVEGAYLSGLELAQKIIA